MLSLAVSAVSSSPPALATASTVVAEWPQFRGGPTHQGSAAPSTITPANVSTLVPAWHSSLGPTVSSPAVVGGVAYVGVGPNLDAFDPRCSDDFLCRPLWTAPVGDTIEASPAVAGGIVYIGSLDWSFYAFDASGVAGCSGTPTTCAPLWKATTGGPISSSAAVSGGRVYVGSDDARFYAFDATGTTNCSGSPKTCAPLWTAATGGNVLSSPAVAGGVAYVASDDGKLYAFDAAGATNCSGSPKACSPLWTATTGPMFSSPVVAGSVVYAGGFDRKLYAFDATGTTNCSGIPKTCAPLWTALTSAVDGAILISSPMVVNGLVFIGTGVGDHYLRAYDAAGITNCAGVPKTCNPLWSGDTGSSVRSSPAAAGEYLYVGRDGVGPLAFSFPIPDAGAFHPLSPARVFDSREEGGAFGPDETRSVTVASRGGVPTTGASSVVLKAAVTQPSAHGYLTIFPTGTVRPLASSINFPPGTTVSNSIVAKLGPAGTVDVFNVQGTTHVVLDVEGWFGVEGAGAGARYHPVVPSRIYDSRDTQAVGPGSTLTVAVGGLGGVPATAATAVVLNVAVTQPTAESYLTLFPTGTVRRFASSMNFGTGQTVSNKVVAQLGSGWQVDIFNAVGSTHVVIDVEGWFGLDTIASGAAYHPLSPARMVDTRATAAVGPGGTLSLSVAGVAGVPGAGVSAVVLNVAVTEPTALGYLTLYPSDAPRPLAASINFAPGQTISNAVVAKVGIDGSVNVYNVGGSTHMVVDVEGWFGTG